MMQTALCRDESELRSRRRIENQVTAYRRWSSAAARRAPAGDNRSSRRVAHAAVPCHQSMMARPNYSGEKRRKELEKQKKKEEKKQRKLDNAAAAAAGDAATPAEEDEQPPVASPS